METLTKISKVAVKPHHVLNVTFSNNGKKATLPVRLEGFIARYQGLTDLKDSEIFKKAKIKDWGAAIGWPDDMDIGASTLFRMAQEQAGFGAKEFKAWQERVNLSNQETADALGVTLSTVKNLRAGSSPVSNSIAIACRAMEAEPTILAAHFHPRTAGRPKAA